MIVVLNDQNELMMMNIAKRLGIPTITLGWSNIASPRFFAKRKFFNNENIFKQWKLFVLNNFSTKCCMLIQFCFRKPSCNI